MSFQETPLNMLHRKREGGGGGGRTQIISTSIPLGKVDRDFKLGEVIAHELFVHVKFAVSKFCHTKLNVT